MRFRFWQRKPVEQRRSIPWTEFAIRNESNDYPEMESLPGPVISRPVTFAVSVRPKSTDGRIATYYTAVVTGENLNSRKITNDEMRYLQAIASRALGWLDVRREHSYRTGAIETIFVDVPDEDS